jgi:hypothetical protein
MVSLCLILLAAPAWRPLEPGLDFAELQAPVAAATGDSKIRVLRVDPAHFDLKLFMASSGGGKARSAREWVEQHDAVAAINPSMFDADMVSSVGLMRTRAHTNNPTASKDKAFLVFGPRDGAAAVRILDPTCDDVTRELRRYDSVVQSIRMVTCKGRNTWSVQEKKWSAALVGLDRSGRVLLIHVRSPYRMHDLIDMLLALPIELAQLMYGEGGPEAQLFVRSAGREIELVGSWETGFNENEDNRSAWKVPNVLAVVRRPR